MKNLPPDIIGTDEKRWQAVAGRDESAAGVFVYAVRTTGIYCRPGCASRLPRRENVEFFQDAEAAEKHGYRGCRRCRPDLAARDQFQVTGTAQVIEACRSVDAAGSSPTVANLAKEAGMSPGYFHRVFKQVTGITPKEYASSVQSRRFLEALERGSTVTDAVYQAGYSGPSRAHDHLKPRMGMSPSQYRRGAPGIPIRYSLAECYLGWVIVAATGRGICAVMFDDRPGTLPGMLRERFPGAEIRPADPSDSLLLQRAIEAVETPGTFSDLPLDIVGTAFQKLVWKALMNIPPGTTSSYRDVAADIGRPEAARAVAGACGANKIAQFIPCHRVIRRNGDPGGYRWGVHRKKMMLDKENPHDHG